MSVPASARTWSRAFSSTRQVTARCLAVVHRGLKTVVLGKAAPAPPSGHWMIPFGDAGCGANRARRIAAKGVAGGRRARCRRPSLCRRYVRRIWEPASCSSTGSDRTITPFPQYHPFRDSGQSANRQRAHPPLSYTRQSCHRIRMPRPPSSPRTRRITDATTRTRRASASSMSLRGRTGVASRWRCRRTVVASARNLLHRLNILNIREGTAR